MISGHYHLVYSLTSLWYSVLGQQGLLSFGFYAFILFGYWDRSSIVFRFVVYELYKCSLFMRLGLDCFCLGGKKANSITNCGYS